MLMARSGHTSVRLLANTRECPPRLSLVTKPSAIRHGGGRTAGGGVRHCWEQSGSQPTGRS